MIDVGQQPSATKTRNKLSILLMDGNSERRALRKGIIALRGVEVVAACDLTEAASIWRRDRYDAVLIDNRSEHPGCIAWRDEIKKEKPQLAGSYVAEEQATQWGIPCAKQPLKLRLPTALRALEVAKIKIVPYAPLSHPFVERLIGTVRREFLDRTLFWTTADLETKLLDFQHYYNGHGTPCWAGRAPAGTTFENSPGTGVAAHDFYAGRTFTACGPFCPCSASYSTWSPSFRDLKPLDRIAD
jgi:hypothetical protein